MKHIFPFCLSIVFFFSCGSISPVEESVTESTEFVFKEPEYDTTKIKYGEPFFS